MARQSITRNHAAQAALRKGFRAMSCATFCNPLGEIEDDFSVANGSGPVESNRANRRAKYMPEAPLISVIIPVLNGEKYLAAAIESILAQNYRPIQLIVVDDGSTDKTAALAKGFDQVEYHFQDHAGVPTALNRGITESKGSFIAFLDADDLWMPGKLGRQLEAFENDPDLSLVLGRVEQFREEGLDGAPVSLGIFNGYLKIAMLIRRSALFQVGFFDTQWTTGDFIDWYIRATELRLKSLMLHEVVAKRRIHETNMGIRQRDTQSDYAGIMRKVLERRRKAKG
jgi:glycosyltransferase involved in cell wall biosynthesis